MLMPALKKVPATESVFSKQKQSVIARSMNVRVRIAPSPTGDPHVGTAYMALFNYAFAHKHQGQFLLRIEDTDQGRSHADWETMIFDALRWLGLDWHEGPDKGGPFGPYRQSERRAIYREYAQLLYDRAAAYPCFCTAERLEQLRREQRQRNVASGYDGRCRMLPNHEAKARMAAGESYVLRLKVPREGSQNLCFVDELRGNLNFELHQVDDQVLMKSDGMPTYHLANVVDDHLMEISHVIRAEEWISSTPKHELLYKGFGWKSPQWIHLPLLRNKDRSKISKRKNPVSINYYREAGYLPEAMLNYLAMMGWTMPDGRERFSLEEMCQELALERISLGGPIFDVQKLTWLNGLYIRDLSPEMLLQRFQETIFSRQKLLSVMPLVHERIEKMEDLYDALGIFFTGELHYSPELIKGMISKGKTAKEMKILFEEILQYIDGVAQLKKDSLENFMRQFCEQKQLKTKELFMPVRIAVTGRKATPPLFETMVELGKERCRKHLRLAIEALSQEP